MDIPVRGKNVEVCALWEERTPQSELYLTGRLGNARLVIVQNGSKKPGSKEPDWRMFLVENDDWKRQKEGYISNDDIEKLA